MNQKFLRCASAILKKIHSRAPFHEVSSEILQCAVQDSESDYGSFVRVDWESQKLRIVATAGKSWTEERSELLLEVGRGITGQVAVSAQTYLCHNVSGDPNYVPLIDAVVSELAIPVIVDEKVWGIINLDSDREAHYGDSTVLRMELLAEMVASALEFRLQMERERALTSSLVEAEKLAAMGHLVAGIAHEVNNPLAAILGCAELLSENPGDEKAPSTVRMICVQAKRAGDLVKQLLAFSRMDAPEDREELAADTLLREVADLVNPSLRVSGIRLEVIAADEEMRLRANRVQIQQILVNLINNAQQALCGLERVEKRIVLEARKDEDVISFEVRDNGPGLKRGVRSQIFEPFFTTKEKGKGTGLGLSISRDLANAHDGNLVCYSRPDEGCVFKLTLPSVGSAEKPHTARENSAPRPGTRGKPSVLIVEDEAPIRWMLQRLFAPAAGFLRIADCAEDGIDFAADHHFDIVISDFHLPGLDGIELYHRISGENLKRFVLITGDSSSPRLKNFAEWPNVDLLEKPFELQRILNLSMGRRAKSRATEELVLPG